MSSALNDLTPDGGFVALSGFYFQMLASFATNIERQVKVEETNVAGGTVRSEVIFGFEDRDADAVQIQGKEVTIIQIKFSSGTNPDVKPSECEKILGKMVEFALKHYSVEAGWTHKYKLLTNRSKSADIKKFQDGKKSTLSRKTTKKSTKGSIPNGTSNTGSKDTLSYPFIESYIGEVDWDVKTALQCRELIESRGRSFGMTGNCYKGEIYEGVNRVFREFWDGVMIRNAWMTQSRLNETFTGYPDPRSLTPSQTRQVIQQAVQKFTQGAYLDLPVEVEVERREVVEDLERALDSYPVVIIEGHGGNGKSTLLAYVLREKQEEELADATQAVNLPNNWVSDRIRHWRNCPVTCHVPEQAEVAWHRLPTDWPSPHVVVLSLDGIDEMVQSDSEVRAITSSMEELPSALQGKVTLVVTCRDVKQHDFLHAVVERNRACLIHVDRLSNRELTQKLNSGISLLEPSVRERLQSAMDSDDQEQQWTEPLRGVSQRSLRDVPQSTQERPLGKGILDALRHPVLWRFFCDQNLDEEQRQGVLDDDQHSWRPLCQMVVEWFGQKYQHRMAGGQLLPAEDALDALRELCERFPDSGTTYNARDWQHPRAMSLLRHTLSAGLIVGDLNPMGSRTWKWRHHFLPRYIQALNEEIRVGEHYEK